MEKRFFELYYEHIFGIKGRMNQKLSKRDCSKKHKYKSKIIPTFEDAFDIMKKSHFGLAHARDFHKD